MSDFDNWVSNVIKQADSSLSKNQVFISLTTYSTVNLLTLYIDNDVTMKSCEQELITKATHTNHSFKFKLALYSGAYLFRLLTFSLHAHPLYQQLL